jgi:hypothetical protein
LETDEEYLKGSCNQQNAEWGRRRGRSSPFGSHGVPAAMEDKNLHVFVDQFLLSLRSDGGSYFSYLPLELIREARLLFLYANTSP